MKAKIKSITKSEVFNSRFITKKSANDIIIHEGLSMQEAEAMSFREICIYLAATGLKFRDLTGSLKNANGWLRDKNKQDFMKLEFNSEYDF